ncbi:putative sulfate exporter family transporter [Sphingobacteriaceae bacterium]|nr:putative sulfate exporter family transporter [Sphingobacteriaceae bacterium]
MPDSHPENHLLQNPLIKKIIFVICSLLCVSTFIAPPFALLLGLVVVNIFGNPFPEQSQKLSRILLQVSVIGLGFGMNIHSAIATSREGFSFTVVSLICTLIFGGLLGYFLKIDKKTSHLISSGTAICGASAIAAISPVISAEGKQITVALATIFILNSVALFLFPFIGHLLNLSQYQFGIWSGIAIHDTSSVVGAAGRYGSEALQIATTVKLARSLWIIPLTFMSAFLFKTSAKKVKIPYFILFFVLAMILNSYVPQLAIVTPSLLTLSKLGITLTLFLIGAGLDKNGLKSVGPKPLLQGVLLWIFISLLSLYAVLHMF